MPTNIQPVMIENVVWFSFRGLSQRDMLRIIGVSQGTNSKVLHHIRETSSLSQGLHGHRLKMTTSKEDFVRV